MFLWYAGLLKAGKAIIVFQDIYCGEFPLTNDVPALGFRSEAVFVKPIFRGLDHSQRLPIVTQGKYLQAATLFTRAQEINEEVFGPNDPRVATTVNNRAGLLQMQVRAGGSPLGILALCGRFSFRETHRRPRPPFNRRASFLKLNPFIGEPSRLGRRPSVITQTWP